MQPLGISAYKLASDINVPTSRIQEKSLLSLSKVYGIDEGTIRKWRDMYLCNGDKGIKPINCKI